MNHDKLVAEVLAQRHDRAELERLQAENEVLRSSMDELIDFAELNGGDKSMIADARAAMQQAAKAPALEAQPVDGETVWLWKNGDHYLAFRHLYPCVSPGGDPLTLGEPFGRAIFKHSHNREGKPNEQQRTDGQGARDRADVDLQRRHASGAGEAYAAGVSAFALQASTGHSVLRLNDPSLKPDIAKLKEKLRSDPKFALATLQSAGIATATGKLSKRFKG